VGPGKNALRCAGRGGRPIESTEVQPRITEGGILIGYWDEDDLAEARKSFKPRFASTNPLVKPTLDRLANPEGMGHDQRDA
jgi:hypothetical protein